MLRPGQAIGLSALALLVIGVVMVNSAGMSVDPANAVTIESILLSRSAIYMVLAVAAMLIIARLPVRWMAARAERETDTAAAAAQPADDWFDSWKSVWPMWLAVLLLIAVLASVYLPGIGREVNHSHRWVNLHLPGLDSIQPSEIAKWTLIGVIAWYGCRNARRMGSFWHGLLPGLCAAGAVSAVIVVEDLGTGALVGMVACLLLIAAGARLVHLLMLAPIPIAGLVLAILTNPYRVQRITSFMRPFEDVQGSGYHMIQSMLAVANGQFFGRGLGHGLQKFGYLPEDTTDFLFAIICEELGVFGAALVMFLYAVLLLSVLAVIRREPSRFFRLVALGVMATVGIQALINLVVVTGLGPTKGIALPLLSSGGTGWILTASSLGLVIAMDRTQDAARRAARREAIARSSAGGSAPAVEPPAACAPEPHDDSRFAPPMVSAATGVAEAAAAIAEAGKPPVTGPLAAPSMDVAPGESGLLFGNPGATTDPAPHPAPTVIVTSDGREWPGLSPLRPA